MPPTYMWLLVTTTDNGMEFYDIFTTREKAVVKTDIDPSLFRTHTSGDMHATDPESGWRYDITEEMVDRS